MKLTARSRATNQHLGIGLPSIRKATRGSSPRKVGAGSKGSGQGGSALRLQERIKNISRSSCQEIVLRGGVPSFGTGRIATVGRTAGTGRIASVQGQPGKASCPPGAGIDQGAGRISRTEDCDKFEAATRDGRDALNSGHSGERILRASLRPLFIFQRWILQERLVPKKMRGPR